MPKPACEGNILVIEDEPRVAEAVRHGLAAAGYRCDIARTGEQGFFLLHREPFDLCVLDLMLPGADGLEVLRTLRHASIGTKVLILSARDSTEDRVLGLESGADDYLVKPFAMSELVARIRVLLRRPVPAPIPVLQLADLRLDRSARQVTRGARPIELTPREYDLLEYLLQHQGIVVSRSMLVRNVWHTTGPMTPINNVIDVHMARLRRKVDVPGEAHLLHTIRGVGFVLRESGTTESGADEKTE